jgi:hypothetical protein
LKPVLRFKKAGTKGPQITQITLIMDAHNLRTGVFITKSKKSKKYKKERRANFFDFCDFAVGYISVPCAGVHESTPGEQNRPGVICGNLRNLRTFEKAHPEGVRRSAQGVANPADLLLEGFSHGAAGAGARKRGAPTSLSFLRSKKCAQIQ